MTPEELSRIRKIYEHVLPMSGPERDAYISRECPDDPNARAEIERLLKAHDNMPDWLEQPIWGAARDVATLVPPKLEGRRLSGYTLVREIGRGGMGSVFLAERSDETFQRRAAIKLILPPANSTGVIARFQQEREILASLDHPNIAKLLDAGVTEEGWPYFVMEFIEGRPIHRWCDERKLNISERVRLFRGVIDAVSYAHRHLVVHRDLKPGNILVTNDGVVKLLDFGIAKVLSGATAGRPADTLTLTSMMTPEYASPEQVNGASITTQSDVYSLGVVLYELLTGHRPYRLLSAAVHEVARVIAEVEPARPSDVVTTSTPPFAPGRTPVTPENVSAAREGDPASLRKRLRGDLDSILLMALRKEPDRRYGSADSLAEDLDRHLEHKSVRAREARAWERLTRFYSRNIVAFTLGVVVVNTFISGVLVLGWQARQNILTAQRLWARTPFPAPFWLFALNFSVCLQGAAVYFARVSGVIAGHQLRKGKRQRVGAVSGGLICGLAMIGRWWLERDLGWWHSRLAGQRDPLTLISPFSCATCTALGTALVLVLSMIGRRFGWQGKAIGLVAVALAQPFWERFLFGEFLPALSYAPGMTPPLAATAILIAAGTIAMFVMRLISGPSVAGGAK